MDVLINIIFTYFILFFIEFSYGFTLHKSQSLEGDYVEIPKNELVVIMNIFKTLNKIECLWKGFIGIFSSDDIKIVYMQNCHK